MVELTLKCANDLRAINTQREGQGDPSRARIFRAFCVSSLRDASQRLGSLPPGVLGEVQTAERSLIRIDISDARCGHDVAEDIDCALRQLQASLRLAREELLEAARAQMERFGQQTCSGAEELPHRRLLTVHVRTLSGGTLAVRCGLDDTLLQLKRYISNSGGPSTRDQRLIWHREGLDWINALEDKVRDTFTLFYLGIVDGDWGTLYYARHCELCEGACKCMECHGAGASGQGCEACGQVKPDCPKCCGPCKCPSCHGTPDDEFETCRVCGETRAHCTF